MERQRISDVDRAGFIAKMERKTTDKKVIDLVREDIDQGLSITQIEDYMDRELSYEQRKAISDMYRKRYPASVVAIMGKTHLDVEIMRTAMEIYDKGVPWEDIKKLLTETKTAEELRNAFSEVLKNVQPVLAITSEDVAEEDIDADKKDDKKQTVPEYVEILMTELKGLIEKIHYQDGRYDAFNEILKECMFAKKEEGVIEKLSNENKQLEAQIKELTEQLVNSQDEVAKRLKNESRLRNEVENGKEEIKKMQEIINELKEENTSFEETVKEQEQAIIAKNAIIEKKNSEKMNEEKNEESGKTDNPQSIPVYYTLAVMDEHNQVHRSDIEYVKHRSSIVSSLMSRLGLRKASHRNLVQMVINRELSSEQVNEIKCGLEKGLNEEQMGLIINKNLSPERIKSIVDFAALQNSLRVGRSEA